MHPVPDSTSRTAPMLAAISPVSSTAPTATPAVVGPPDPAQELRRAFITSATGNRILITADLQIVSDGAKLDQIPVATLQLRAPDPYFGDKPIATISAGIPPSKHGSYLGSERLVCGHEYMVHASTQINLAAADGVALNLSEIIKQHTARSASPIILIGREGVCHLQVPQEYSAVSGVHVALVRRDGHHAYWCMVDGLPPERVVSLQDSTGTRVPLAGTKELVPGSVIAVGRHELSVPELQRFSGYSWALSVKPEDLSSRLSIGRFDSPPTTIWESISDSGIGVKVCGSISDARAMLATLKQLASEDRIPEGIGTLFVAPIPGECALPDGKIEPILALNAGHAILDPSLAQDKDTLVGVLQAIVGQSRVGLVSGVMCAALGYKYPLRLGTGMPANSAGLLHGALDEPVHYTDSKIYRVNASKEFVLVRLDLNGDFGQTMVSETMTALRSLGDERETTTSLKTILDLVAKRFPCNQETEDGVCASRKSIRLEDLLKAGGGSSEAQVALFGMLVESAISKGLISEQLSLAHCKYRGNVGELAWCRVTGSNGGVLVAVPAELILISLTSLNAEAYRAQSDHNLFVGMPLTSSTCPLFQPLSPDRMKAYSTAVDSSSAEPSGGALSTLWRWFRRW